LFNIEITRLKKIFFINFLVFWLKEKEETRSLRQLRIFLFEYVWIKIRKIKENPKKLGNSYRDKFFFVLPNWRYFLLFLHFMQKFKYMYFLFVKKGSTLQERKVQKYITIGE